MCVQQKWIKNRFSSHPVLVKCGHCPACMQEKANKRTVRLRNTLRKGEIALFVTLTYANDYIPYIKRSDLVRFLEAFNSVPIEKKDSFTYDINIYRDFYARRIRRNANYDIKVNRERVLSSLESVSLDYNDGRFLNISYFKDLKNKPDCIGVCYYPDIQNFNKRLKQNLARHYGFTRKFRSFSCSEYGAHSSRPHFHQLLFIPAEEEASFRLAINESWLFASDFVKFRSVEVARNAASYVSSYINRGSDFPRLFEKSIFRPKCSYSADTGLEHDDFLLSSILEKIRKRDLRYFVPVTRGSATQNIAIPLPKYVISRYFPLFKGFSRLTTIEALDLIKHPEKYNRYAIRLDLCSDDVRGFVPMIRNAYKRFIYNLCLPDDYYSLEKYAQCYCDVWKLRAMNLLEDWYRNDFNDPLLLQYDNWNEVAVTPEKFSLMTIDRMLRYSDLNLKLLEYDNPNTFPRNVMRTQNLAELYHRKCKTRYVTNFVLSKDFDV